MNKKIFTLFAGALLLLGSAFTASAQTPSSPYQYKYPDGGSKVAVAFRDSLSVDSLKKYMGIKYYYSISLTGIANATSTDATALASKLSTVIPPATTPPNSQIVLFVDGNGSDEGTLRLDTIGNLDFPLKYEDFVYEGSTKFGAIRRASWCVSNKSNVVTGSNQVWDFTNMETGKSLDCPLFDANDATTAAEWDAIANGHILKDNALNMFGENNIVSGWHFSQTYDTQDLQTSMPLYSYVGKDSVVVLVLADTLYETPDGISKGGWKVTVKQVSVNDLIANAKGEVKTGTAKQVENVLLFSLKKINPFVLNANDFNAVNSNISFDPDANLSKGAEGWNPFTLGEDGAGNNGKGWLTAEEVSDSLYHYGYMYMKNANGYLYVDTAFWNDGNDQFLKFNWTETKRDSSYNKLTDAKNPGYKWGDSFDVNTLTYPSALIPGTKKPDSMAYHKAMNGGTQPIFIGATANSYTLDSLLKASGITAAELASASAVPPITVIVPYSSLPDEFTSSTVTVGSLTFDFTNVSTNKVTVAKSTVAFVFTPAGAALTIAAYDSLKATQLYLADSINFKFALFRDSLMENQSKFRVVYDPWEDNAKINVYQSRVRYPNRANASVTGVEWPNWWENSFDLGKNPILPYLQSFPTYTAQDVFQNNLISNIQLGAQWNYHRFSDAVISGGSKHGGSGSGDWNSFLEAFPQSSINNMDKVMISTADTNAILWEMLPGGVGGMDQGMKALAHTYSYSVTTGVKYEAIYQDSLLYIAIQNLEGNSSKRIATLAQSGPKALPKISLGYGPKCEEDESKTKASVGNDLYLIRNSLGQYLCVPIWSAMDSLYWVYPEKGEDPSRMPCYQWAVENLRSTAGSPFKLTNREFERVSIPYVYVYANKDTAFDMAGQYAPKFNNRVVYPGISKTISFRMAVDGATMSYDTYDDGIDFVGAAEKVIPLTDRKTFLPLSSTVKGDQLLGYKYIDKDSTLIDVYALRYKHFMTSNTKPRYVGWNGYKTTTDTTLYVNYDGDLDRLFFDLQEMPFEDIDQQGTAKPEDSHIRITNTNKDFESIYKQYAQKLNNYQNSDSLVMEKFGYMPISKDQYDYNSIKDLRPLARQAYRFLLKDYYKFSPTINGDFWTVGENDNYILADKVHATKKYKPGSGDVAGVFGIPYFYFRNTFFDYHENDTNEDHDYFALVQRLDTVNYYDNSGTLNKWEDIKEYLTYRFGKSAALKVQEQIIKSKELGVFVAVVEDYTATLKMAVRGDAAIRVSTFRLHQDDDPLYRRFHGNDSWAEDGWGDKPDTLEFHKLNKGDLPEALYENSGTYLSFGKEGDNHDYGANGGRIYNFADKNNTTLLKDSLGNVISFLGINNMDQYPSIQEEGGTTNYSLFVDTAYINRGTGWIKPQYMLAVDPYTPTECGTCQVVNGAADKVTPNRPYVLARYLFNTAMYAKQISDSVIDKETYEWVHQAKNFNMVKRVNTGVNAYNSIVSAKDGKNYCNDNWERLAFAWAIHKGDSLYVLKGVEPAYGGSADGDPEALYIKLSSEYGKTGDYIDFDELVKYNTVSTYTDDYYNGNRAMKAESRNYSNYKSMAQVKADGKHTIGLQAIINLNDNTHKDWVFSMRYFERGSDDFIIESETTDRDTKTGAVIRPGYGGWVKYQNGVPTITRSDEKELLGEGTFFNVEKPKYDNGKTVDPVSNEAIANSVKVIAGTGNVTILNATGKKVVISNILGQMVANTVLSSDNASVAAPAGVVIVAVEGETAVKAIVK